MNNDHATQACAEGRRAGLMLLAPSLNPYRDDDPLHAEWNKCWRQGMTEKAALQVVARKMGAA